MAEITTEQLRRAWKARPDLQKEFPTMGAKGKSADWYMMDWAKKYGIQEMPEIFGGVEEGGEGELPDWAQGIIDLIDKRLEERPTIEPFVWTDEDTASNKAEFEELYGPYYGAQIATEKRGAREAIEELEKTTGLAVKREERSLEEALTDSRASMAARGYAFSGIKEAAEERAKELSTEQMKQIRDIAGRGRRETLAGLETQIGTQATQSLYPGYALAPEYAGAIPGITGIPGEIYKTQDIALQQELARRQAEARQTYLSDIVTQEGY